MAQPEPPTDKPQIQKSFDFGKPIEDESLDPDVRAELQEDRRRVAAGLEPTGIRFTVEELRARYPHAE